MRESSSTVVNASIDLYTQVAAALLPTPAKFHYRFNLRDMAKVFQGVLMVTRRAVQNTEQLTKLWIHECSRVFYDRLINTDDRALFAEKVMEPVAIKFKYNWKPEDVFNDNAIIFTDLRNLEEELPEDIMYELVSEEQQLISILQDQLIDYNSRNKNNKMELVFFNEALHHICRLARILRQPRGNAMLIGVSGCGKQSLTKLASHLRGAPSFSIVLSKSYKPINF